MTKEQYEKISAPFCKNDKTIRMISKVDKVLAGLVFFAYPLLIFCLLITRNEKCISCIFIPAVSFVSVSAFRRIYSAPRPYEVLEITPLLQKDTIGKSFPSRHVFSVFMIAMTFYYVLPVLGIVTGVIGILIAYIRVVGGVHFPKDVFAGAVIGILCGLCFYI